MEGLVGPNIFLNIAQLLAIQLPDGRERMIANKWIKKFSILDKDSRDKYVPMFVFCLQQKRLVKPFSNAPSDYSTKLNWSDKEYTMDDIKTAIGEAKFREVMVPSYKIDMSQDMTEIAVYQEIPNFGSHFYFAVSTDPINKWQKFTKLNVPKELAPSLFEEEEMKEARKYILPQADKRSDALKILKRKQRKPDEQKPEWQDLIERDPEVKPSEPRKGFLEINLDDDKVVSKLPLPLQKRILENEAKRVEKIRQRQEREEKAAEPPKAKRIIPRKQPSRTQQPQKMLSRINTPEIPQEQEPPRSKRITPRKVPSATQQPQQILSRINTPKEQEAVVTSEESQKSDPFNDISLWLRRIINDDDKRLNEIFPWFPILSPTKKYIAKDLSPISTHKAPQNVARNQTADPSLYNTAESQIENADESSLDLSLLDRKLKEMFKEDHSRLKKIFQIFPTPEEEAAAQAEKERIIEANVEAKVLLARQAAARGGLPSNIDDIKARLQRIKDNSLKFPLTKNDQEAACSVAAVIEATIEQIAETSQELVANLPSEEQEFLINSAEDLMEDLSAQKENIEALLFGPLDQNNNPNVSHSIKEAGEITLTHLQQLEDEAKQVLNELNLLSERITNDSANKINETLIKKKEDVIGILENLQRLMENRVSEGNPEAIAATVQEVSARTEDLLNANRHLAKDVQQLAQKNNLEKQLEKSLDAFCMQNHCSFLAEIRKNCERVQDVSRKNVLVDSMKSAVKAIRKHKEKIYQTLGDKSNVFQNVLEYGEYEILNNLDSLKRSSK